MDVQGSGGDKDEKKTDRRPGQRKQRSRWEQEKQKRIERKSQDSKPTNEPYSYPLEEHDYGRRLEDRGDKASVYTLV